MVFSVKDRILIKVWPANSPDLNPVDYRISGETARACLPQLDSLCGSAEVTPDWRVGTILFQQSVINEAVKQWRKHLQVCIRARGRHF